jgi:hypothetical protein
VLISLIPIQQNGLLTNLASEGAFVNGKLTMQSLDRAFGNYFSKWGEGNRRRVRQAAQLLGYDY